MAALGGRSSDLYSCDRGDALGSHHLQGILLASHLQWNPVWADYCICDSSDATTVKPACLPLLFLWGLKFIAKELRADSDRSSLYDPYRNRFKDSKARQDSNTAHPSSGRGGSWLGDSGIHSCWDLTIHVAPLPQCKEWHTEESGAVPAPHLSWDFVHQVWGKNLVCKGWSVLFIYLFSRQSSSFQQQVELDHLLLRSLPTSVVLWISSLFS